METYERMLEAITAQISIGYNTVHIYRPEKLAAGQIGYSVSPTGEPLYGDGEGDWKKSWLVIGYDEVCGDPIFIDRAQEGYPVYIAIAGQGRWDPQQIAVSLEGFRQALAAIASIACGRENPVAFERNPVTQSEKQHVLGVIRNYNPKLDLKFWEILIDQS